MNFITSFRTYRALYMGIAILFVILYHMPLISDATRLIKLILGHLYIGVDFFMCASGFGLCYALKKHNILLFYTRRLFRIYPAYAILALLITVLYTWSGHHFSTWDIFCQFSTLQYYQVGGIFFDWYLSASILLYVFFPLLFKCKIPYAPSLFFLLCAIFIAEVPHEWTAEALAARIGIFTYGILMYRVLEESVSPFYLLTNGIIFICIISVLYFFCNDCRGFALTSAITPALLYGIYIIHNKIKNMCYTTRVTDFICILGKYSLSLYVANIAAQHTLRVTHINDSILYYYALQFLYSLIMISIECYVLRPCLRRIGH